MTIVHPEKNRAIVEELSEKLIITIPVKRNWFVFLFLTFWLCAWAMGEIAVLGSLLGGAGFALLKSKEIDPGAIPAGLFMLIWLCGWTVGGIFAIAIWLYQLKGKEIIVRDRQFISHKRDFVIYQRAKEYMNDHIQNLRVSATAGSIFNMSPERALEFWGVGGGPLSFDYGAKTIRIGSGLDEAEAKPIIELLSKYGI